MKILVGVLCAMGLIPVILCLGVVIMEFVKGIAQEIRR